CYDMREIDVRDCNGYVLCFGQDVGSVPCASTKGEQTMKKAKPVPEGHHTVTAHLVVRGADQAIAFYQEAFGAKEVMRMACPISGKLITAEIKIGDSFAYLCADSPDMG